MVAGLKTKSQLHINMLEMMAIRFALENPITFIHHSCVMISTDNTIVVSYINRQGGTHSPNLCIAVWKILSWCLEILKAAVWSHSSTFVKFYLRDMSQQAENLQRLGPVVVAQKSGGTSKTMPLTPKDC